MLLKNSLADRLVISNVVLEDAEVQMFMKCQESGLKSKNKNNKSSWVGSWSLITQMISPKRAKWQNQLIWVKTFRCVYLCIYKQSFGWMFTKSGDQEVIWGIFHRSIRLGSFPILILVVSTRCCRTELNMQETILSHSHKLVPNSSFHVTVDRLAL